MKTFFEEYGFVLVSIVVVALLVGMTTPIGETVKDKIDETLAGVTFNWNKQEDGSISPSIEVNTNDE